MPGRVHFYFFIFLLALAACSRQETTAIQTPVFAPHPPHESPFKAKRVLIREPAANLKQSLVAVVDNQCADVHCAEGAGHDKHLSCFLSKGILRNKEQKTQFYDFNPTHPSPSAEIEKWIHGDKCILGISEQQSYRSKTLFNDTYFGQQETYFNTIRYAASRTIFAPGSLLPVKVAVIDTGVGVHEDFAEGGAVPNVSGRYDLRSPQSRTAVECNGQTFSLATPWNFHGTYVGGIIGAKTNNSLGIAGLAPNAEIHSIAVGNCLGQMSTSEIGNALLKAYDLDAEVVNLSLAGPSDDPAVRFAIITLLNKKAVVVVAAGNEFRDLSVSTNSLYPVNYAKNYPGLISVAWGTQDGGLELGDQASWGSNYSNIDVKIIAPGTNLTSLKPGNAYGAESGSSAAAPVVTSAAAVLIGYLKQNKLQYDEQMVDTLITTTGARFDSNLGTKVRNGAVLDFEKLATVARSILTQGTSPAPITVNSSLSFVGGFPQLTMDTNWSLPATHYGARIGIFDTTCGFSAPCLIQSKALSGNQGTASFNLSRNETLPILGATNDPEFKLFVSVGIYYPIKDKNNFGLDAVARINLRDFDGSGPDSAFLGKITGVRYDQQWFYVQGWTCLDRSNKAAPVQLINESGQPIPADFGYSYSYMVPHSSPIDGYSFSHIGGPFVASGMETIFRDKTSMKAGWEANPEMIGKCHTFTTAHGFEYAVKLSSIQNNNLAGTKFSVRATNPKVSSSTLILQDDKGTTQFAFPEVNYQPNLSATVNMTRRDSGISLNGELCSKSPSPIEVEISFNEWDFRCRQLNRPNFPDFTDRCQSNQFQPPPPVYDPGSTDRQLAKTYIYSSQAYESQYRLNMNETELARHHALYPTIFPNAWVHAYGTDSDPGFLTWLRGKNFQEVLTGDQLWDYQQSSDAYNPQGPEPGLLIGDYLKNREGSSMIPHIAAAFWDYYDVGEGFTPSIVAYSVDNSKTVGAALFEKYRVRKLMREVKKYETPIGVATQVLGRLVVKEGTSQSCGFRFQFSKAIEDLPSYRPSVNSFIWAFLKQGEPRITMGSLADTDAVMRQIPIDVRFYQDGVMIGHLLSNFGTSFTTVPTLGRAVSQ